MCAWGCGTIQRSFEVTRIRPKSAKDQEYHLQTSWLKTNGCILGQDIGVIIRKSTSIGSDEIGFPLQNGRASSKNVTNFINKWIVYLKLSLLQTLHRTWYTSASIVNYNTRSWYGYYSTIVNYWLQVSVASLVVRWSQPLRHVTFPQIELTLHFRGQINRHRRGCGTATKIRSAFFHGIHWNKASLCRWCKI